MRLTRLMSAALVVVAAAVAACSSDATSIPDGPAIPGATSSTGVNYTLQSVNAMPLPAEMRRDANGTMSVTRGVLTLRSTGFVQTLSLYETTFSGQTSTRDVVTQGTFTVSGDQIHFRASDGGEWTATFSSGGRIEYSVAGNSGQVTFVFVLG